MFGFISATENIPESYYSISETRITFYDSTFKVTTQYETKPRSRYIFSPKNSFVACSERLSSPGDKSSDVVGLGQMRVFSADGKLMYTWQFEVPYDDVTQRYIFLSESGPLLYQLTRKPSDPRLVLEALDQNGKIVYGKDYDSQLIRFAVSPQGDQYLVVSQRMTIQNLPEPTVDGSDARKWGRGERIRRPISWSKPVLEIFHADGRLFSTDTLSHATHFGVSFTVDGNYILADGRPLDRSLPRLITSVYDRELNHLIDIPGKTRSAISVDPLLFCIKETSGAETSHLFAYSLRTGDLAWKKLINGDAVTLSLANQKNAEIELKVLVYDDWNSLKNGRFEYIRMDKEYKPESTSLNGAFQPRELIRLNGFQAVVGNSIAKNGIIYYHGESFP